MAIENFTTYTEVDPNAHIGVAAAKLDIDGMTRDEEAYVYDDKGAAHFGATFEHDFDVTPQAITNSPIAVCWAVSNVVDDDHDWDDANDQAVVLRLHYGGPDFRLKDSHFGEKSMVVSNLGMHGVDVFFPIRFAGSGDPGCGKGQRADRCFRRQPGGAARLRAFPFR